MGLFDLFRPKWKHSDFNIQKEAVEKIDEQSILEDVAENSKYYEIQIIAINKIKNQELLRKIATSSDNEYTSMTREAATKRLDTSNISILQELQYNDAINIREMAQKRIKELELEKQTVVICCPSPDCIGIISSQDPNLIIHLTQLSRGGMVTGSNITCGDCGKSASISEWHEETSNKYGKDYLSKADSILSSAQ